MGFHATAVWPATHASIALSSGEAEFYGATSVVMDGRMIKGLFEWLKFEVVYVLHFDSSAAKSRLLSGMSAAGYSR